MYLLDIVRTFLSKAAIFIMNFVLLLLTTHFLGSEGRGAISLLMADIAIIVIFNNILSGNSVLYFIPRFGFSRLILPAFIWIFLCSTIIAAFFTVTGTSHNYWLLLGLTFITSITTLNLLVFMAKDKIYLYNIFSFFLTASFLIFILICFFILHIQSVNAYLVCYFLSQCTVFIISLLLIQSEIKKDDLILSKKFIFPVFTYGWKNELSYFIQFINYRLSYFFIFYFQNIASVGVFSVAIAISESIWLINKSITTVQFAKLIKMNDAKESILLTKKSAIASLLATIGILFLLALIPSQWFGLIFGHDFKSIKPLIFILMPGIIAIAVSNVYGHYFAASNQMKTLIIKSIVGLVFTILGSVILIPLWGLKGACITTSLSYLISSGYIIIQFFKAINCQIPIKV